MTGTENNISSHVNITEYIGCCSPDEHFEDTGNKIWIFASPVLIILGTIGNIVSGKVMLGKRLRKHTTSVYLIGLAVVDTFILYADLPWNWINAVFKINIRDLSFAYCKINMFCMYYVIQLEAWILVCVSIERLTAVFLPLKAKKLFTKRSALIQMATVASALFVVNAHVFWTQTLIDDGYGHVCTEHPDFATFRLRVNGWIDMVLASVLPFSVMLVSSIAICGKLYKQSKIGGSSASSKTTTITFMLITVCVVFVLCSLPVTIFLCDPEYFVTRYGCCFSMNVIWPVVTIVMFTNNAVNFLLYSISGPRFRDELRRMFPSCKNHQIGVEPSSAQTVDTDM